jgi:hypothetical protein
VVRLDLSTLAQRPQVGDEAWIGPVILGMRQIMSGEAYLSPCGS